MLFMYDTAFSFVIVHYCKHAHFLLLPGHALSGLDSLWQTNLLENTVLGSKDFFLSRS